MQNIIKTFFNSKEKETNSELQAVRRDRKIDNFEQKFKDKSFFEKHFSTYQNAKYSSFLFQLFSALTAITLVSTFLNEIIQNYYISTSLAVVILLFFEKIKRDVSSTFFSDYVKEFDVNIKDVSKIVLLSLVSIFLSFGGADKAVKLLSKSPTLLSIESNTKELKQELETINNKIDVAENQKNSKGQILYKSLDNIKILNEQKAVVQNRIFEIENKTENKNDTTIKQHESNVSNNAFYAALTTFFLELCFIYSIYKMFSFEFKTVISRKTEQAQIINIDDDAKTAPTLSSEATKLQILESQLQQLQQQNQYLIAASTNDFKQLQATNKQQEKKAKKKKKKTKQGVPEPKQGSFLSRLKGANVTGTKQEQKQEQKNVKTLQRISNKSVVRFSDKEQQQQETSHKQEQQELLKAKTSEGVTLKKCLNCESVLLESRHNRKYCSNKCKTAFYRKNKA